MDGVGRVCRSGGSLSRERNNPVMAGHARFRAGAQKIRIEPRQLLGPARCEHPAQSNVVSIHPAMISGLVPCCLIRISVVFDTTSGRMIKLLPAHSLEGCRSDVTPAIPLKPG